MELPKMQWAYIKLISDLNRDFSIRPLSKQISLLGILLDYIIKIIKLLYDVSKTSINYFAIYHP